MDYKIIDVHAHLGKVMHAHPPLTVEDLLRFMDTHHIEKSVVLPLVNPEEEDYYYTTEQALQDCARYPDRLIPFANVDPRRGSNDGHYDFFPLLQHYAELGCRGFGEILASLPTNDPRMKGIYAACGRLRWPVVFDFRWGTTGVQDPPGLPYLEECLQEFPDTIFVGHGPGFWGEMAAEVRAEEKTSTHYPDRPVLKPGRVAELLDRYPNMYADLSAYSCYRALTRDLAYARQFLQRFADKLMFGTDRFVGGYMQDPVTLRLIREMQLPPDIEYALFRGTAEHLLGL